MMVEESATYDIALVMDGAPRRFSAAEAFLDQLRQEHQERLREIDILFLDPALLVCLMRFDPEQVNGAFTAKLAGDARHVGFQVLKPMLLSNEDRQRFYEKSFSRMSFRETNVRELSPVFDVLRSRLQRAPAALAEPTTPSANPMLSVHYNDAEAFLKAYRAGAAGLGAAGLGAAGFGAAGFGAAGFDDGGQGDRIFVASSAAPNIGASVRLEIRLGTGQGPLHLTGRVASITHAEEGMAGQPATGCEVSLVLSPDEIRSFESFLVAVRRGSPWPEQSGRRHNRFSLHLPVDYRYAGGTRQTYMANISRGGAFIEILDPPPLGSRLTLRLYAAGRGKSVEMEGEVLHATSGMTAAARGQTAGFGIRFAEPAEVVHEKLEEILGSVDVPVLTRALVVDDDRFFRVVLGNVLKLAGFEVFEAADGNDAFQLLLDEIFRFDALLVDLYLPGMSGSELVNFVRSVGGADNIVVILLTGAELGKDEWNQLTELGADAVISKQTDPEEILHRLEEAMQRNA